MMHRFPKLLLVLTLLLFSNIVVSQSGGLPKIINYTKAEYQSGTQNWDIDQDENGNIYLANNNGLIQFDGSRWHNYKVPNSANIRSVEFHKPSGRIYVGGYNEFGYFKSDETGTLKYVSLVPKIPNDEFKLFDYLWKIHILDDEIIFQSFKSAFILKNDSIQLLEPLSRFQFSFKVNGKLYFQDISYGILEYKNGALIPLLNSELFNNSEIWAMLPLSDEKILITTLEAGLYIFENNTIKPWKTEANNFAIKNSALSGLVTNNHHVILNSVLGGVIICNLDGDILQELNLKTGLQNNTILSSFIDKHQNLWLGLDNGISYVHINSPFSYSSAGLNFSTVYASLIHNQQLYIATNQGVFYHELANARKNVPFEKVEGTAAQTWNIQEIGNELVCANNNGAFIIENGKVEKVLDNKGYFGFKEIPSNPNYVIGANYRGFTLFKKTKDGLNFMHHMEGFDKSSNFFEIDQSYLWLLKNQYLYQLKLSDDLDRLEVLKVVEKMPDGRSVNGLNFIRSQVTFKAENKFYNYSEQYSTFVSQEILTELFEDIPAVYLFREDQYGNIWYSANSTPGEFILKDNGTYEKNDEPFSKLKDNIVVNYLPINALDKENAYIGLIDGLAHYNRSIPINKFEKPRAYIRSFTYEDNVTTYGNPQDSLRNYKIPFSANNVKFTFSSPEFEDSKHLSFSYRLDNFDEEWSPWSEILFKEYTNLEEGKYMMEMKVKNSFGVESNSAALTFTISPPWYRHIIAYLVYGLLSLSAVYLISIQIKAKIRKNKYYELIEQRKLYLEKESKIKIEQFQLEKEIEKLNREKLQTSILAKDKELVNNSLQVVKKNKILNGIIKKLKEMDVNSMDDKTKAQLNKLKKGIVKEVNNDNSWKDLEKHIKNVHFDFLKRLKEKHPTISPRELDLSTYLLMNMSTKEIAEVMNITTGGVELARYRLRKKLELERKQNLTGFLMDI